MTKELVIDAVQRLTAVIKELSKSKKITLKTIQRSKLQCDEASKMLMLYLEELNVRQKEDYGIKKENRTTSIRPREI
jgi:hypothetical protein